VLKCGQERGKGKFRGETAVVGGAIELRDVNVGSKDKYALNYKRAVHAMRNHDDWPSYITLLHLKQIIKAKCYY